MSVKHVNAYFKQICDQYQEMINDIKDVEKEAEQGLVEPERIERLKEQVAAIKQNYERWSYMMFLLHQPNRKEKVKKYQRQNAKLIANLSKNNSLEGVIAENTEALTKVGK
jgi:uncharacterized protein YdcH (DUF465 family)